VTARLQPAPKEAMVDEENSVPSPIQDEGRCGHMAWKGAAGVNVIPILDLTPQESVPVMGQSKGVRMIVEDHAHLFPEGSRIEVQA
jgi:hypothetical protein